MGGHKRILLPRKGRPPIQNLTMDYEDAIRMTGYAGVDDYFKKIVLPVVLASILAFIFGFFAVFMLAPMLDLGELTILLYLFPLSALFVGSAIALLYPYYGIERIKVNIHENIHYFITYAGALSTLHLPRKKMFRLSAQRIEYGYIAKVMEKVAYLSDSWNLSLVTTCRKLSSLVPSKVLGNFLDRMSAAFDFGARLDRFLLQEQSAVMEDFASEYKQSLQTLSMIQDALVSLTIAVAFMMAVAFMLPLIMGYDIYVLIILSGSALLLIDVLSLVFIDIFITHDDICHKLPIKPKEYLEMKSMVAPIIAAVAVILAVLLYLKPFGLWTSFLVALGMSPLAIIGFNAREMEEEIIKRDMAFPAFIRSLGGSMSARGGSLYGTLGPLRVHEFGVLNELVDRLYKRLIIRCDKFSSWMYFSGESGSSLIQRFGTIFIQVISLGGDPEKASVIISDNFIKLLSLRELKIQLASSVKGVYYGTTIGVAGAAFASLRMVGILDATFKKSFSAIASTPAVASLTAGLLPSVGNINMVVVEELLFFLLLIHVFFAAYSIKMVDGGSRWAFFLDFVIMVWLLAAVAIAIPALFDVVFSSGASASGTVGGITPV
jgi:archaeal flagellar protein FlaJ